MMRNTWQAWLRRTAVTVLFCFSGGVVASAPAQAYDHAGLARDALEHHIRPGYKAFDAAAASFNTATIAMCAAPSADGLASVRAAFKEAALSWARAEHLSFGPIADDKRKERLLFWPDPKGITRKQVSAIIETADETAFDSRLAGKSVAVQGFTALDIVLFGDGSQAFEAAAAQGSPRCRYAQPRLMDGRKAARMKKFGFNQAVTTAFISRTQKQRRRCCSRTQQASNCCAISA
jgi:predicted lipoprotein